jgi:metacaspase-1
MPQGLSIHIGVNEVDPTHYKKPDGTGWTGELTACEVDARAMQAIAEDRGFTTTLLLTKHATTTAVRDALVAAAKELKTGDMLLVTYSGHGGQVPDRNYEEGADARDETWVLYDQELVDDELYALWSGFKRGVRILVLSDSCHSGTVVKEAYDALMDAPATRGFFGDGTPRFRNLPPDVEEETYRQHKSLYDGIQQAHQSGDLVKVGASIILISGCQDNQLSLDGEDNGYFTASLLTVWDEGRFRGGLRRFHREIAGLMPPWQSPNLFWVGKREPGFERKHPFTI